MDGTGMGKYPVTAALNLTNRPAHLPNSKNKEKIMIRISHVLSLLILLSAPSAQSIAKDTVALPGEKEAWSINGTPVSDSDNLKSKNGFGASLWIINDASFFDAWNKPETPTLRITNTAIRNQPVFISIIFTNPGTDDSGKANVTADVTITSPDGKIYGEFKDTEVWQREYPFGDNTTQLAVDHFGIKIEDHEQLGTYGVVAVITDKIRKTTLVLKTDFTAKEK
jgi:hypothetical protein